MSVRIKRFVLDEPSSQNAFSPAAADRLRAELSTGKTKLNYDAVLFTSRGSLFCSGGNLAEYAKMKTAAQGKAANRKIGAILDEVAALTVPTACVVQGDCLGGGIELLSAFDYVVSVPEAQFGFWQRRIGLSFGWGGRNRLERRLPSSKIDKLAISARNLSSFEALETGLIDEIAIASQAEEAATRWLHQAATLPALPLQQLKKGIGRKVDERKFFEKLWWNPEHLNVLRKFKR